MECVAEKPIVNSGKYFKERHQKYNMKTTFQLAIISSLLIAAAGCKHDQQAKYEGGNQQFSSYPATGASRSWSSSTYQPSASQNTTSATTAPQTQTFGQAGADNAVVQQVQQQLRQDPTLAPLVPNLQISFQNGTLMLAGNVPSEQEKSRIETIVKSTSGVVNVNNQLQVSSQSQLNLPGTENKTAAGGTSDQTTTTQSTGTQSSQPSTLPSGNEQSSTTATPQPSDQSTFGQSATNQPNFGQSLTSTNQSSAIDEQKTHEQNLSPTSDQQSTSRLYGTNQSNFGTSGTNENFNVKVQAATEADRTLGQQVVQELRTDTSLQSLLPMIRLNVDNGKITISGRVNTEQEKKQIESAVQRVTGATNVENKLRVSSTGTGSTTQDNQPESK